MIAELLNDRQEEDAIRTQEIERYGYQVIRFRNEEVMDVTHHIVVRSPNNR